MLIPGIIAAFKKLTKQVTGCDIRQTSYYDHIIRDKEDFDNHMKYIDENPIKRTATKALL
jgi:hypothetical protein